MFRDGMYDKDFAENWTHGLPELQAYVEEYTPERVEEITGVPAEKLEAAVKLIYENAPSTLVSSSAGACHATNVGNFQRAVFQIISLMGSLDVPGGMAISPGLPFDYTATTAGLRLEGLYEEKNLFDLRPDKDDFPVWAHYNKMIQVNKLPEYVEEGKIRAGVLLGANAMMWPQTPLYQEAIKNMEFTVAIDYYMRPWTHDYVDMLLPAAMCYERMAPIAVFGRKIFLREPVVEPAGQAREDWRILLELGCALGFEEECFGGSVEAALEDMMAGSGLGITLADLREHPEGYDVPGEPTDRARLHGARAVRLRGAAGLRGARLQPGEHPRARHGRPAGPELRRPRALLHPLQAARPALAEPVHARARGATAPQGRRGARHRRRRPGARVQPVRRGGDEGRALEHRAARCGRRHPRLAAGRHQPAYVARLLPDHRLPAVPLGPVRGREGVGPATR